MKKILRLFDCELRAEEGENGVLVIEGYAAVFDKWTNIGDMFEEIVRHGAFTKTLMEGDPVALWNHDDGKPLGRKSRGTLEVREDNVGLYYRNFLDPNITAQRDAYLHVQRGDVEKMSFGFNVMKETFSDDRSKRELLELRLIDVSPVTFPAYTDTVVVARSAQAELDDYTKREGETTSEAVPSADTSEAERRNRFELERKRLELAQAEFE